MNRALASYAVAVLVSASANLACTVTMRTGSHSDGTSPYRTVRAQEAGFSLDVPETWVALNLAGKKPEDALTRFRQTTGLRGVGAFFTDDAGTVVADGFKLYAFKPTIGPGPFDSEVFVLLHADVSWPPHQDDIRGSLSAWGAQDLTTTQIRIAGVQAVVATYRVEVGDRAFHRTECFLLGPAGGLQIAFNTRRDGRTDSTVQSMIRSLRLLR
jgi:hypothetical protein